MVAVKKERVSPLLKLKGKKEDPEVMKWLKRARSNVEEPVGRGRLQQDHWDHLIAKMVTKNAYALPKQIAASVARRAKSMGYVVRLTKLDEDFIELWFGGFKEVPRRKK